MNAARMIGALTLWVSIFHTDLQADNWPAWRGPLGTGICAEKNFPTKWAVNQNIKWRVSLPERGNSSPVVWGNQVFITQAIEAQGLRQLVCFDRRTGRQLWKSEVEYRVKEPTHRTNPFCSASPVTDGKHVVVSHASAGLFCYDMKGKRLWSRDLGVQHHVWGNAASPVIHDNLCLFNFGPGERTFLIAVSLKDGSTVWQHDEPGGSSGIPKEGGTRGKWVGSWTTPVFIEAKTGPQLLMTFPNRVVAFDPAKGYELWDCKGLNPLVYTSPIYGDGIVVAMGGFSGTAMGVRAGGKGDVTKTHQLWTRPREKQRIGSGVMVNGHVYILNEDGIAQCIEARKGKVVWEERLRGPGGNGKSWSSMVAVGDKLYAINQSGDAFILRAAPRYQLLAVNSLGEMTQSSMAFSNGEVFVRTYKSLWCISGK
ncbi:MAG: PQQ-binding-like beta-propeller repeat protein [Verrucomicrobiota bacterium]|nr:PQQ-binding-like beta-propeller repeat protein [Verrucomicrobiota bacterium]